MGAQYPQLHVAFFPLMAPGHTLPMLDIVTLFASQNVKTTILTTPLNAPNITKSLHNSNQTKSNQTKPVNPANEQDLGPNSNDDDSKYMDDEVTDLIRIEVVPFPDSQRTGLPQGLENLEHSTSQEMSLKFLFALDLLKHPLEEFLEKHQPDCLVADLFIPFVTDVATKFGIPRLVFHGSSFFAMCVSEVLIKYEPQKSVSSDDDSFLVPGLPHKIEFMKSQTSQESQNDEESDKMKWFSAAREAESKSFGVVFNSFYEVEPDYVEYYKKVTGKKAWHIGPVSLFNKHIQEKSQSGEATKSDEDDELRKWLDLKQPSSVIYVCFGSLARFSGEQLKEIAMALEASGQPFVWVVKKGKENEEWLTKEFEKKTEGRGVIVRGWAPQVMILNHNAIGGFVTHCGWNSTLEAISAGIPMVTWPLFADQFSNEKLVTEVLKIGVKVGSKHWNIEQKSPILRQEEIVGALNKLMVGKEGLEIRNRAKKLKEMACKAVGEGGSSFKDLSALIQELRFHKTL